VQSAINELDSEKQAVLVSGTNVKTVNSQSIVGAGNLVIASGSSIIDTTHAALVDLRNAATLTPGQRYRITDFVTKYARPKWTGTDNVWTEEVATSSVTEPLVVVAIAVDKIGTQALTALYPQDVLVYDIDAVAFTVNAANTGTRKGYIGRRTDTRRNNSLPYDYRHMKWNRYKADLTYFPTFEVYSISGSSRVVGGLFINSATGDLCCATVAGSTNARDNNPRILVSNIDTKYWVGWGPSPGDVVGNGGAQTMLPLSIATDNKPFAAAINNVNAVFIPTGAAVEFYTFSNILTGTPTNGADTVNDFIQGSFTGIPGDAANTVISTEGGLCYSNTFGDTLFCNTIDMGFNSNTAGPLFDFNVIGKYCNNNIIGQQFTGNTVGDGFWCNTLGYNFAYNIVGGNTQKNNFGLNTHHNMFDQSTYSNVAGDDFFYNYLGRNFIYNRIGSSFRNNIIASGFSENSISYAFNKNTIGLSFYSNDVGGNFHDNVVGDNFYSNSLNNNFHHNTIGEYFNNNALGSNIASNTIGSNFRYNTVGAEVAALNLTGGTHVYSAYSCRITNDSGGTTRLSYINSSGVPAVALPND
jgi:hypothetical protein